MEKKKKYIDEYGVKTPIIIEEIFGKEIYKRFEEIRKQNYEEPKFVIQTSVKGLEEFERIFKEHLNK